MINFNLGNKIYSDTNYASKSYTIKEYISTQPTRHLYYPKVSHYGVSDNSFDIIDHGDSLSTGTHLIVKNSEKPDDSTFVELYLKINNNTLSNSNLLYDTKLDTNNIFLAVNSSESFALVSYELDNGYLTNPSIIHSGSFMSLEYRTLETLDIDIVGNRYRMNGSWDKEWLTPIVSVNIVNRDIASFPLGSTFSIVRSNSNINDLIDTSNNATIDVKYTLNRYTVSISGGLGYAVDDTFTVDDGNATDPGVITVTEVGENGEIVSIEVSDFGIGFTDTPVVSYDNTSGSNCEISISDSYGVVVDIIDGGNCYSNQDYLAVTFPGFDISFPLKNDSIFSDPITGDTLEASFIINTSIIPFEPLLNNLFSIDSIKVIDPGFNHKAQPLLKLVNTQTEKLISNTYITTNINNFIDITETL